MKRLMLVWLGSLIVLIPFSGTDAQVTLWCPAGDGGILAGFPPGDRTVDLDFSGAVNVGDFAIFGGAYSSPPKPYTKCADLNNDGTVTLSDFSIFGFHFGHAGPVAGLCI